MRGAAVQPRLRLPHEVVVEVGPRGLLPSRRRRDADEQQHREARVERHRARSSQTGGAARLWRATVPRRRAGPATSEVPRRPGAGRRGGRCYTPVHLIALAPGGRSDVDTTPALRPAVAVGTSGRPLRALTATPALILLLLGGLALRLTIAYVLFPYSGFADRPRDLRVVGADAGRATARRLLRATPGFADYPPAYLYVLWPIGVLANALGGNDPAGHGHGAHQAAADAARHRGRVRALPPGAGLDVARPPRGDAWRWARPHSTCSTPSPCTTRPCGARPMRPGRS